MKIPQGYLILSSCENCKHCVLLYDHINHAFCNIDNTFKIEANQAELIRWSRGRAVKINGNCPQHRNN